MHSFVYYTCDRSSSPPQSGGWTVVFTVTSARHTQGASPWGGLWDRTTAMHSGWMCLFRHRVAAAWMWHFWENNCIFKYRSWWLSTTRSGTEMDIWVRDIKHSSCLSFSFLFRDWKCSPATNFPRSGRYKYFTYKYLYQLCSIGFARRNALVSDLCLSLRSPSPQNKI